MNEQKGEIFFFSLQKKEGGDWGERGKLLKSKNFPLYPISLLFIYFLFRFGVFPVIRRFFHNTTPHRN